MPGRSFDVAVLGAGPAAMMAALAAAARHEDVALVVDRLPREDDPPRVDAVPARLIALLVEFGIAPRDVGVDRVHTQRALAWSTPKPRLRPMSPAVHLERPGLECALLARALRHPGVTVFLSRAWTRDDGLFRGDGWRARRLVDATGRLAVSAESVTRPAHPWGARSFWWTHPHDRGRPAFALTALPEGYVYRMGARLGVVLGFVGRGTAVEGAAIELEDRLRSIGAGWMLDDLPPLVSFREGRAGTASVQWAEPAAGCRDPGRPARIGEAALARDPLSSQGIAAACAEALLTAAFTSHADIDLFEQRQREERLSHLTALQRMLEDCRWAGEPTWRDYAAFVADHAGKPRTQSRVALRDGRITSLPEAVRPTEP